MAKEAGVKPAPSGFGYTVGEDDAHDETAKSVNEAFDQIPVV